MPKLQVLSAERYDYTKKDTGQRVSGTTLTVADSRPDDQDHRGLSVYNIKGPLNLFDALDKVPGLYEVDVTVRAGFNGGEATARALSLKPIKAEA